MHTLYAKTHVLKGTLSYLSIVPSKTQKTEWSLVVNGRPVFDESSFSYCNGNLFHLH
jgi:hypothetical protein